MASVTKRVALPASNAWVDLSEGNTSVHLMVRAPGNAEIYFGTSSTPADSAQGEVLNYSNRDGMSFSAIAAADKVWGRTSYPDGLNIMVVQKLA